MQTIKCLTVLASLYLCAVEAATRPSSAHISTYTVETAGVTMAMTVPTRNNIGEPISVRIVLKNAGPGAALYSSGTPLFFISMKFNGKELSQKSGDRNLPQDAFNRLEPGTSLTKDYDLHKMFSMSAEGTYSLSVARSINDTGDDDWEILEIRDVPVVVGPRKNPFLSGE